MRYFRLRKLNTSRCVGELKVVNIQKHTALAFFVVTNYNMSVGVRIRTMR